MEKHIEYVVARLYLGIDNAKGKNFNDDTKEYFSFQLVGTENLFGAALRVVVALSKKKLATTKQIAFPIPNFTIERKVTFR